MTETSNPALTPANVKQAIANFLADRLRPKLEKLGEEDADQRARLQADYAPAHWVADAARRVTQIQQVTHAIKYTHPEARGSSRFSRGNPQASEDEVGTHSIAHALVADVVGNAAALDVYKFLNLNIGEHTLLELAAARHPALAQALSDNPSDAETWMQAFASLTEAKGLLASHALAKQVYWPLSDGTYHLLAPLFPTSLVHAQWQTLRQDRFSEEAKAARSAWHAKQFHPHGVREYPELAIRNFGGSKPQNISQLNSERYGENYLLASLPPNWESTPIALPWGANSIFDRAFARRPRVRDLSNILRDFLVRTAQDNNIRIREKRAELTSYLCDEALLYAAELRDATENGQIAAGWTLDARCKLNRAEQCWLDPLRSRDDPDFARDCRRNDWPDEVCRRFGNWLNACLTTERTPMGAVEAEHWQRELEKEMRLLRQEIADHE